MHFFRGLATKKFFPSASAERRKKEQDCYLKNGSAVLQEFLSLCDGNCRIPIRYFTATEIERAIKHSEKTLELSDGYMGTASLEKILEIERTLKYPKSKMELCDMYMVLGSMDNRLVLVRYNRCQFNIHRDMAITAQMSHLKNVLRLIGCCLEFESPVMVYEYVEGISLGDLLFKKEDYDDQTRKSLLSWGNRLRIAREVASAIVFLHTEFTTPIIHRDIKPSKVIIDQSNGVAKIVDFSLSISLPPGELEAEDHVCGTLGYLDPEYGFSGIITQKTDIYSFGVLLFQLLTAKEVPDILLSNIRDGNVTNRVDSTISTETIDFEEGNAMNRVDSAILEEKIDLKNIPTNFVNRYIKEGNVMNIADATILEEHGIEIQQQLKDYLDLVKKCTADKGDDRPYIIHVARELRRIEKCFRALTLDQK